MSYVLKWPREPKKKSLDSKALGVNHVLLGSELLKFKAKCNSATGSFQEPRRLHGPFGQRFAQNIQTGRTGMRGYVCGYTSISS